MAFAPGHTRKLPPNSIPLKPLRASGHRGDRGAIIAQSFGVNRSAGGPRAGLSAGGRRGDPEETAMPGDATEKGQLIRPAGEENFLFRVPFGPPAASILRTDDPPPLGEGAGPDPSQLLGAAVGS